ncbi:MAG: hypothetical protein M3072_13705 [Candidatus Dormibacteraeota bacterium]|nr:hypothetical protein [Candidatus Dormibacteraeota bacterium]
MKERQLMLRRYRFDCHVDHRSHHKISLRDSPPICVRNYEDCQLYREERRREDDVILRYTE